MKQQRPETPDDLASPFPHPAWQHGLLIGAVVALLAYLVVFYVSRTEHWEYFILLFLPDQLATWWIGGTWERFGILDRGPLLIAAAGQLLLAWLLGHFALDLLGAQRGLRRSERVLFSCGLGLQGISLWVLLAGLFGWLHQPAWILALPLILLLLAAGYWVRRGGFWEPKRAVEQAESLSADERPASRRPAQPLWLAAPCVLLLILGACLPPWEFDVCEYHLQIPKEWQQQGWIGFVPHNVYGNMPLGAEMQALLPMTYWPGEAGWWYGALVGKVVTASMAVLTAMGLYLAGERFLNRTAGWAAAVIYLSTGWVAFVSMAGLVDAVVGFFLFLACYAALLYRTAIRSPNSDDQRSAWRMLVVSGWLAGAAVSCKYPALLFCVVPLGALIGVAAGRRHPQAIPVFLLVVTLSCGLWFAKNVAVVGNPVYPLMGELWTSPHRTPQQVEQWETAHQVPRNDQLQTHSLGQLVDSLRLIGARSYWLSPLLVPLAVLALLHPRRRFVWQMLGVLLFGIVCWWMLTHRIERFLVPLIPIVALLAGAGASWNSHVAWRLLVGALIALQVASFCLHVSSHYFPADNRYFVDLEELRAGGSHETDPGSLLFDPAHRYLNQRNPDEVLVLLVGDARPFDLQVPVLYNTCFDTCQFERLLAGKESGEQRRQALRDAGVTHVLINWSELDRYRRPGNYGYSPFVTRDYVQQALLQTGVLEPVVLELDPQIAQLFRVRQAVDGVHGR